MLNKNCSSYDSKMVMVIKKHTFQAPTRFLARPFRALAPLRLAPPLHLKLGYIFVCNIVI